MVVKKKKRKKKFRVTQLAIISQNTTKPVLSCLPLVALYSAPDLEKMMGSHQKAQIFPKNRKK